MRKQSMWTLVAVAITLLVLSTSAQADIVGYVYRLDGNMLNAGPIPSGATLEGSFTAPLVDFEVLTGQSSINTLEDFLDSGSANYSNVMPGLNQVMSNIGINPSCAGTNSCYSTAIDIVGTGYFVNGQSYTITHDDGVVMHIGGASFIDAPGPVSAQPDSAVYSGSTGNQPFEIWYMATNGNPEVLTSDIPVVPDGGVTLMLLGGALVGLESLRRKFRV